MGLISKKATLHVQHTFFVHFSTVVLHDYIVKLPEDVTRCLEEMSYVFSPTFFSPALVADSISHFVTAATKFSCCPSNKKCLLCFFISRSRSLSLFFSFSFAGLPPTFSFPSVFLLLYISNLWTRQLI